MVPKEFRVSLCVTAGWVTLVQAVIWALASIYIIGVYMCTWEFIDLEGVSTWSMLYITYLMGECKGEVSALRLGYIITPPTDPAKHLQIWMWIYTVVSAVWIPTCILLIVAAMGKVRGRHGAMLYFPWVGLTSALIVLDLGGAVYHIVDVLGTTSPDSYAKFTGASSWDSLTQASSKDGVISWLPSLFITLFFCRFLVVWLLNIYFVYGVYKASNAVSLYETKYTQTSLMTTERKKTWKSKFYEGPDPSTIEQQSTNITAITPSSQPDSTKETRSSTPVQREENQPGGSNNTELRKEHIPARLKTDESGITIEEFNTSDPIEDAPNQMAINSPRSPYHPTGQVFDFTGRPVQAESMSDRWRDSPPPIASGVQVPPELVRNQPFSYMRGDQPQLMRRVVRANSKAEYPPIPRPDYTIAERRAASLEYVPNRFKVPSPKRPVQESLNINPSGENRRPPNSPAKVAPIPPKKPQVYPRSTPPIHEDVGVTPQPRYIPQQVISSQQQAYYTRQTSQNNNYNINKLY